MNIRTKTKRRVAILVSIIGVVVVGSVIGVVYRKQQIAAEMAAFRATGLAAAKAGEYLEGLPKLSRYITDNQDDVEALYYYALSRRRIEDPQGKHIDEPIGIFRQVLRLDPDHADARRELLELYRIKRWDVEAIELADEILAEDASNVKALIAKGQSLEHQNKFPEAMEAAARAVQLAPTDLEAHALILSIMAREDRPATEMIEYARKQLEANPQDPQSELLVAMAYSLSRDVQDRRQALDQLREIAKRTPPNEFFIRALVHQLDVFSAFGESLAVLEKHAPGAQDTYLRRLLARRLLELGRYDRLIELFAAVTPQNKLAHTELLGAKAYALLAGRTAQGIAAAMPYIDALDQRESDPMARGWWLFLHEATLPVLRAALDGGRAAAAPSAQRQMQVLQQALTADPGNPFVHYRLGEVYAAMGEAELALTQWQRVAGGPHSAGMSASWSTPLARMSQIYNVTGRPVQAFECAFTALSRHNEDALANLTLIESLVAVRRMGLESQVQSMVDAAKLKLTPLEYVQRVQSATPGEEQTLPLYVDLLGEAGRRDDAIAAINQAIEKQGSVLSEQTLLRLITVDDRYNLGLGSKLLHASEAAHGVTPQLAATRAGHLAADGKRDEALDYMRSMMARHGADDLTWQLAHGQLLDSINHPDARRAWAALGEKYAAESRVQRHMLTLRTVQNDPDLMRQTIDRLRQVSGDDAITWKLAHARWLLTPRADPGSGVVAVSSASAREAVDLLNELTTASPDLVDARLLLATAHQTIGNIVPAINNLNAVLALQPQRTDILMQLARLRMVNGEYEQVAAVLQRATRQSLSDVQRRQTAMMWSQMGRAESAIQLLESAGEPDLILAELYLRSYDPANPRAGATYLKLAEQMYQRLMDAGPTREVIASYAAFLAATNRREEATQALARLSDLQLAPGERELTLAEYKRRYVGADEAAEDYRRATEAAPQNIGLWRERIEHLLSTAKVDLALEANAEALRHNPGNELLKLIATRADAIRAVASKTADATGLVSAMLNDADHRAAAAEALEILYQAQRANAAVQAKAQTPSAMTTGEVVQRLRELADDHPAFVVLNRLVMHMYLVSGRHDEALDIARRTAEKLPGSGAAHTLVVDAYLAARPNEASSARARRYEEALAAARRIMEKFPTDAAAAERVARILAAQGNWSDVVAAAAAWRERSLNSPMPADLLLAEAHLNLGRTSDALDRLKPYTLAAAQNPQSLFSVIALQVQAMLQESARQAAAEQDQTIERAANLLKPHLAGVDSRWRTLWMTLAARSIANPQLSAAWLQRVEPVIPAESQNERMALAGSWFSLSRRSGNDEYRREALRVAADLAESAAANADIIVAYGILAYQCGDIETAANQYRRALKADPAQYQAQNNLAILLADQAAALRKGSAPASQTQGLLDEALDLAQQAVSRNQSAATYYDTLAYVLLARREYDKAISQLARAVELEPYQPDWRINLAGAYVDSAEALAGGAGGSRVQEALAAADRVFAEMDERRMELGGRPDLQERRDKLISRMQQLRGASASVTAP